MSDQYNVLLNNDWRKRGKKKKGKKKKKKRKPITMINCIYIYVFLSWIRQNKGRKKKEEEEETRVSRNFVETRDPLVRRKRRRGKIRENERVKSCEIVGGFELIEETKRETKGGWQTRGGGGGRWKRWLVIRIITVDDGERTSPGWSQGINYGKL